MLALVVLLSGSCAGRLPPFPAGFEQRELVLVPFFPQEIHQCGPAALATVLVDRGVATTPEALVQEVYLPGRGGSLQPELVASVRRHGQVPYLLEEGLGELVAEVDAGRPVLVLQNLGIRLIPRWHYAVVVGYDRAADALILRSGVIERRHEGREIFLRTWARSTHWAMVVLGPGELPARADPVRMFAALAAVEAVGRTDVARAGYAAMANGWPDRAEGYFGLGNLALAMGAWRAAEAEYRKALEASRGAHIGARNNLAMALLGRGCVTAAMAEVDAALVTLGASPQHTLAPAILDTKRQIEARAGVAPDVCLTVD